MQLESVLRGAAELSNENNSVNGLGTYSKTKQIVGKSADHKKKQ